MTKAIWTIVVVLLAGVAGYTWISLHWSYSTGERSGYVQKLSRKGWVCKTWEGEIALVSIPGTSSVEKFQFTVRDPEVAASLSKVMGKRVTVHYEQKVGLPTSCFGETRYYVTGVTEASDISLSPGVTVPQSNPSAAASAGSAP